MTKRSLDEIEIGAEEEDKKESVDWSKVTEADLELKEFKCPRCDQVFSSTSDLFVHMRHAYKDPTLCKVCGKNMNCMANILSHSYLHDGIKPYKCPKCDYCTRTRFNLRVHFGACAKVEKFCYKRGAHQKKKKYAPSYKKRRVHSKTSIQKSDFIGNGENILDIPMPSQHDIISQLVDAGPDMNANRDISCLIRCHVGHFPRSMQQAVTDRFYQKSDDINKFYQQDENGEEQQMPPMVD